MCSHLPCLYCVRWLPKLLLLPLWQRSYRYGVTCSLPRGVFATACLFSFCVCLQPLSQSVGCYLQPMWLSLAAILVFPTDGLGIVYAFLPLLTLILALMFSALLIAVFSLRSYAQPTANRKPRCMSIGAPRQVALCLKTQQLDDMPITLLFRLFPHPAGF